MKFRFLKQSIERGKVYVRTENNKEYIIADDATPQGAKADVHTKKKLPKTGGSNETVYFSGGAMLILLAIGMVVKRKENGIR